MSLRSVPWCSIHFVTTFIRIILLTILAVSAPAAQVIWQEAESLGKIGGYPNDSQHVGYPQREDKDGRKAKSLFSVDDTFGSALDPLDSALLAIDRGDDGSQGLGTGLKMSDFRRVTTDVNCDKEIAHEKNGSSGNPFTGLRQFPGGDRTTKHSLHSGR